MAQGHPDLHRPMIFGIIGIHLDDDNRPLYTNRRVSLVEI